MPFWAGMLTEEQHLHEKLRDAVRQASWDLYFRDDPICNPPKYVKDPGVDLEAVLREHPLLIMERELDANAMSPKGFSFRKHDSTSGTYARISAIKNERHQSWSNLYKGVLAIQEKAHEPFGTTNVRASALSDVRKILREVGLTPIEFQVLLERESPVKESN